MKQGWYTIAAYDYPGRYVLCRDDDWASGLQSLVRQIYGQAAYANIDRTDLPIGKVLFQVSQGTPRGRLLSVDFVVERVE